MAEVNVQDEVIGVPSDRYGAVLNGRLLSFVRCPTCQSTLRIMARFDDDEQAAHACDEFARQMPRTIWEVHGTSVVGTGTYVGIRGVNPHGARSTYGYNPDTCSMLPYYGTEREFAVEVWNTLWHTAGMEPEPFPRGPVDLTSLDTIKHAKDQLCRLPPLILYKSKWLSFPIDLVYGQEVFRIGRSSKDRDEFYEKAPYEFRRLITPSIRRQSV